MSDFVVHTPEQLAAHDAATSKRYLEALRELQAENARLRAHIEKAAQRAHKDMTRNASEITFSERTKLYMWHLAALGETK